MVRYGASRDGMVCTAVRQAVILLNLRRRDFHAAAATHADELKKFVHTGRCRVGSATTWTDNPCACSGREEQTGHGTLPHVLIERGGVCRFGIEMSNCLLQPRGDFGGTPDRFLCEKAVHLIAQPDLDAAIP